MSGEQKKLIYGVMQDELYFMPANLARKYARIRHAVEEAATWGELKKMVTRSEFDELKEQYEFSWVADEKLSNSTEVDPFFLGEDFYEHPGAYMQEWLPDDIISKYGKAGMSMMDGILINFEPADEEAIIKELESRGYTCECKQDLLAFTTGEYCENVPEQEFLLSRETDIRLKQAIRSGKIEIIDSDSVELQSEKPLRTPGIRKASKKTGTKKTSGRKNSSEKAGKAKKVSSSVKKKTPGKKKKGR